MLPETAPSSPYMWYFSGNRPLPGPTHQALITACLADHDLFCTAAPAQSPFLNQSCWIVNYAPLAQQAAIAFHAWDYQVHNGGYEQFFSNTDGWGYYLIDAMLRVLAKHPTDPKAVALAALLRDVVAAVVTFNSESEKPWLHPWDGPKEFAEACARPAGERHCMTELQTVVFGDAAQQLLADRYEIAYAADYLERMEVWLQTEAAPAA